MRIMKECCEDLVMVIMLLNIWWRRILLWREIHKGKRFQKCIWYIFFLTQCTIHNDTITVTPYTATPYTTHHIQHIRHHTQHVWQQAQYTRHYTHHTWHYTQHTRQNIQQTIPTPFSLPSHNNTIHPYMTQPHHVDIHNTSKHPMDIQRNGEAYGSEPKY